MQRTPSILIATLTSALFAGAANADTINIPNGNVAALIAAINAANANGVADTINLATGGTYTLATPSVTSPDGTGLPYITSVITINGNGATLQRSTAGGTPQFRLMQLNTGGNLTLNNLTLRNGSTIKYGAAAFVTAGSLTCNGCTIRDGFANQGGGAFRLDAGAITLTDCTLTNNASGSLGNGGALEVRGAATATSLTRCSITACTAPIGGGIFINNGTLTLLDCTLSGNTATSASSAGGGISIRDAVSATTITTSTLSANSAREAGGIEVLAGTFTAVQSSFSGNIATFGRGGAIRSTGTGATFTHCTITQNTAQISGGGISGNSVTLNRSIVAGNTAVSQASFRDVEIGMPTTGGYNLIGATALTGWQASDIVGTIASPIAAQLSPLADNGGLTQTHRPTDTSPAIDVIPQPQTYAVDQRGLFRPRNGTPTGPILGDIGAVERDVPLTAVASDIVPSSPTCPTGRATVTGSGGRRIFVDTRNTNYCVGSSFCGGQAVRSLVIYAPPNWLPICQFGDPYGDASCAGYSHHPEPINLTPGGEYRFFLGIDEYLTLSCGPFTPGFHYVVYADWNGDGDFQSSAGEANEQLVRTSDCYSEYYAYFTVPADLHNGIFRMRFRGMSTNFFNSGSIACTSTERGETEDFDVYITGGTEHNYLWSNGATTPTITNVPPGDYTCTVSDADGTSLVIPVTIPVFAPLVANAGPDAVTCADDTVQIGMSTPASGGVPPYSFAWSRVGAPQSVVDQTTGGNGVFWVGRSSCGQSFTAGRAGELDQVELTFSHVMNGSAARLAIYRDADGNGTPETLATDQPINLITGPNHLHVNCPVPMIAGSVYSFVIYGPGLNVNFRSADNYAGGQSIDGQFWDLAFTTWVRQPSSWCDAEPIIPASVPGTYHLVVTDANGCTASDDVILSVRPESPCVTVQSIALSPAGPYMIGQSVNVTVTLNLPAPAGGLGVLVSSSAFATDTITLASGAISAQQTFVISGLGVNQVASAERADGGGIAVSPAFSVLPKLQSIAIVEPPPYIAGQTITLDAALREPALAGGARVRVESGGFGTVFVDIPAGQSTASAVVALAAYGNGFNLTASAISGCTGPNVSAPTYDIGERIYYVNAVTGNNMNDGLTPVTAFATLMHAIELPIGGITIHVAAGTYYEHPDVGRNRKIVGAGPEQTIIDGSNTRHVFYVAGATLEMSGVTVRNGASATHGGGIYADWGNVVLRDCIIRDCTVPGAGGAILAFSRVTATNCAFINNHADAWGGAIFSGTNGTAFTNCTFSGNTAGEYGGAIFNDSGGGASEYNAALYNCTLHDNHASQLGGALAIFYGSVTLQNSLMAGNTAIAGPDAYGRVVSNGYNLFGSAAGINLQGVMTGNLLNVDPRVGPLANNGGTTPTHALLPDSPAIDAGHPSNCVDALSAPLLTDQRGLPRPTDGDGSGIARCDIGAFEAPAVSPGDLNCDSATNAADVPHMIESLLGGGFTGCDIRRADLTGDGMIDGDDIQPFLAHVFGG